jgi:hypothetical protein
MKRQTKHSSGELELNSDRQAQHISAHEFATTEEALREDRRQTVVPPAIEQRLSKSIENLPLPAKPWWKRLLGK